MILLKRLWLEEDGADAMEYALVAALIVTAMMVGATAFAGSVNKLFDYVATRVDSSIPLI